MISWINLISRNTFLLTCNKNGLDRNTLFLSTCTEIYAYFWLSVLGMVWWLTFCLLMRIGKFVVVWLDSPDFSSVFGNCSIWTEFSGWCNIQNRHLRPQCRILYDKKMISVYRSYSKNDRDKLMFLVLFLYQCLPCTSR